jgi:uncharacterized protein YcbK (DUF882 family)
MNGPLTSEGKNLERRDLLKNGLMMAAGAMAVPAIMQPAMVHARGYGAYKVAFRNAHTGESFSGVYRVGDKYLPEAFERINYVLRDFRTGEVKMMDPHLVDLMYVLHYESGARKPFEIISGYRSPKTNAMLRRASTGVARRSLHMEGKAVDLRLADASLSKLRRVAIDMQTGGVGYYPRSNFLHIDTGRVRQW